MGVIGVVGEVIFILIFMYLGGFKEMVVVVIL